MTTQPTNSIDNTLKKSENLNTSEEHIKKTNSIDSELEDIFQIVPNLAKSPVLPVLVTKEELKAIKALYVSRKEVEKAINSVASYETASGELFVSYDQLCAKLLPPTKGRLNA